jgi:long-chain acyl-CoA synthetase
MSDMEAFSEGGNCYLEEKVWHQFWPKGMPRTIDYPVIPVGAVIKGSAERFGEKTALIYHEKHYSYARIYREALKFANALHDYGIGRGDVVAIHMPNCPQYTIVYYGILLCGATFSPANPLLPPDDLSYQLNDCGAVAVVTHEVAAKAVQAVLARTGIRLAVVCHNGDLEDPVRPLDVSLYGPEWHGFHDFKEKGKEAELNVAIDPKKDLAHLAYTGGTTGRSKGVMLPHYNVVVNTIQFCCWNGGVLPKVVNDGLVVEPADPALMGPDGEYLTQIGEGRLINLTPWFHAMGTVGYLNNPVLSGTTMILQDRFDPGKYLADAEKYKVTTIGGAPPIFVALLRHPDFMTRDLSSVRNINSGAAPLAVELINLLKRRFPKARIGEGYGLTEVTMGAVSNPGGRSSLRKAGSVGIPVFDTEVKIVSPDGGDEPLAPGEKGEICIRGPQVMAGYYNKPEETAAVLKNGWLRTGDIGYLDQDGYLYIVDRKKDMLIYKGYNVYPRELEELLFQNEAVANAAVIGKPVLEVGEIPKAYVVLKAGYQITEEALMETVNQRVAPYKKIRELTFVDEIPVSAAGKVLKRVLRDRELKGQSQ